MTEPRSFECGCVAEVMDDWLVYTPCSEQCPKYLLVLAESAHADVPVTRTYPEGEL